MKRNAKPATTCDAGTAATKPFRRTAGASVVATASAVLSMLAGCASPLPPQRELASPPSAFRGDALRGGNGADVANAAIAVVPAGAAWWKAFNDPVLDDIAERAARGNASIEAAAARLAQARALLRGSQSARALQLGANVGISRQGGPLVNAAGSSGTLITAAAGASLDVDIGGRLARAEDAAGLDEAARAALLQGTRLQVQAEAAQAYFGLRGLDVERAAARRGVQAWQQTLQLTEQRWRTGSVAEAAVLRLRAELAASQADVLALDRRRAELEHALALLLGEPATNYTLAERDTAAAVLPAVPPGIPSQVLARRPDVAAAQRSLQAARARGGEARAAWFPSLVLTATGGHASPGLAELLQASTRAWGLSALLSLPLLDGGRRVAAVEQADAAAQLAFADYRAQVLLAFREVEDQLSALGLLASQAQLQAQAAEAAARALAMSESRWRNGLASQLELLDAQRSALLQQRQQAQVEAARFVATVGLMRALGGGWEGA